MERVAQSHLDKVLCTKIGLAKINCSRGLEYTYLRPKQVDVLYSVMSGRDTIAVLPTGYGKSLIFELLPHALTAFHGDKDNFKYSVIVASPLDVIIQEQMQRNIDNAVLVTKSFFRAGGDMLDAYEEGKYVYIVGHPENLVSKAAFDSFVRNGRNWERKLGAIVIDEAHCVVKWGPDFRPCYLQLKELKGIFPGVPMVGLTATASTTMQLHIAEKLGLEAADWHVIRVCYPLLKSHPTFNPRYLTPY
jgi:ATP-dependent DNA helicase RecQ